MKETAGSRSVQENREERDRVIAELCARIDGRIRPVVAHFPESEIAALVMRIASFKYKHEGKAALNSTPPRSSPKQGPADPTDTSQA